MFNLSLLWFVALVRLFRSRDNLVLENFVLRRQLAVLKRRHPRPGLNTFDKLFWVAVRRFWSGWKRALIIVTPETVVRWHRASFRSYGRLISRVSNRVGRRQTSKKARELIFWMVRENPTWGAPRIHGELLMLGFAVSERTISRWIRRALRDPELAKRWLALLRNRHQAIAAMDFFTAPTIAFGELYCLFIISHDRRRILHFNVTTSPSAVWIVQQLREAFPFEAAPRFLLFDRDAKYKAEVPATVRSMRVQCVRTSFQSPCQNGVAERWIESCRSDLLNHIIAVYERHLKRLLPEYVRYYHEDRTHRGLGKETPGRRIHSVATGNTISRERLGGLHHRYDRAACPQPYRSETAPQTLSFMYVRDTVTGCCLRESWRRQSTPESILGPRSDVRDTVSRHFRRG